MATWMDKMEGDSKRAEFVRESDGWNKLEELYGLRPDRDCIEIEDQAMEWRVYNTSKYGIQDIKDIQGIYAIVNLKNNYAYIGSSKNIRDRCMSHARNLKKGKHHSYKLQRAYNREDSKDVFIFIVLEVLPKQMPKWERFKWEQMRMDKHNCTVTGYNVHPRASGNQSYADYKAETVG